MRVVLHADASAEIGTGHVTRCLALAAALRAQGDEVTLASNDLIEPLARAAQSLGVSVATRSEAPRHPDWIVIDGYHLDAPTRSRLAEDDVPCLVVDDLPGNVDAEMVLNQNLYASPAGPTRADSGELLAGPAYALLRPDFTDARASRDQPAVATRLLVTMGGSDPHDATSVVVRSLAGLEPAAEARVLIGPAHPAAAAVERLAGEAGDEVVRDAPTLAPHLAWSDLVVSSCGSTVLEAVRLGRPIVGIVLADNQLAVARALEDQGLGRIAGRHPGLDEATLRGLVDALRKDRETRTDIAQRGPGLVDGRGAMRVARALATGPLRLRPATMDDADLLLAWRNDPESRAASFDRSEIDRATHLHWLGERLRGTGDRVWIGELGGRPAGVVRFAIAGETATISVTVAPEQRGRGLATRLISSGCSRLAREGVAGLMDAWIRAENGASIAAFEAAGFRLTEREPDRLRFRLALASVP